MLLTLAALFVTSLVWVSIRRSAVERAATRYEIISWIPWITPAEECLHRANLLSLGPNAVPKLARSLEAREFLWEKTVPLLPRPVARVVSQQLISLPTAALLQKGALNALYALGANSAGAASDLIEVIERDDWVPLKIPLTALVRINSQSDDFRRILGSCEDRLPALTAVGKLTLDPTNSKLEQGVRDLLQPTSKGAKHVIRDTAWILGETHNRAARFAPDLWNLLTNEVPKLAAIERHTALEGDVGLLRGAIARALWQIEDSPKAPLLVLDFYRQQIQQSTNSDLWKRRLCLYIGFFGDIPEFADAAAPLFKEWSQVGGETGEYAAEAFAKIEAIRQAKAEVAKLEAQWKRSE